MLVGDISPNPTMIGRGEMEAMEDTATPDVDAYVDVPEDTTTPAQTSHPKRYLYRPRQQRLQFWPQVCG